MNSLNLPTEPLPANFILLREKVGLRSGDYQANSRYYISAGGDLIWASNAEFPKPAGGYWNTDWPATPIRRLGDGLLKDLNIAIAEAGFDRMQPYYADKDRDRVSHPTAESWTVMIGGKRHTVIVEDDLFPPAIKKFRDEMDRIISEAPMVGGR